MRPDKETEDVIPCGQSKSHNSCSLGAYPIPWQNTQDSILHIVPRLLSSSSVHSHGVLKPTICTS